LIVLRLVIRKLSCGQTLTNTLTDKQTPLKTSTSLRYANRALNVLEEFVAALDDTDKITVFMLCVRNIGIDYVSFLLHFA